MKTFKAGLIRASLLVNLAFRAMENRGVLHSVHKNRRFHGRKTIFLHSIHEKPCFHGQVQPRGYFATYAFKGTAGHIIQSNLLPFTAMRINVIIADNNYVYNNGKELQKYVFGFDTSVKVDGERFKINEMVTAGIIEPRDLTQRHMVKIR